MRSLQALLSTLVVIVTTVPGWLAADGVQLPDAMLPQQSATSREGSMLARGEAVNLQRSSAAQRPQTTDVEITRTDRTGRTTELQVSRPHVTYRPTVADGTRSTPTTTATDDDRIQPQVVISDKRSQAARRTSPPSMASALFPEKVSSTNPYGDMNDTRGLRPYKPGVRYDRQTGDERDSSVFGLLFGR